MNTTNTTCTCQNRSLLNEGATCEICMGTCNGPDVSGYEVPDSIFTLDYFEELEEIELEMRKFDQAA